MLTCLAYVSVRGVCQGAPACVSRYGLFKITCGARFVNLRLPREARLFLLIPFCKVFCVLVWEQYLSSPVGDLGSQALLRYDLVNYNVMRIDVKLRELLPEGRGAACSKAAHVTKLLNGIQIERPGHSTWTSRSVSYRERNSGMQTQTKVVFVGS